MPEAAVRTEDDQCLEVLDHQMAGQKLQDVLSLRLPSFYRCAFRLLGNAADAEDAVQDEGLRRLLGCVQSVGKGKRLCNQR